MTRSSGLWIAVTAAALFGAYPPAARAVYEDGGNVVFMILITSGLRAAALSLYCLLSAKPLFGSSQAVKESIPGGFFQALSILSIFSALHFLPGPVVIVVVFTHTLMLLFFMAWRREIKLDSFTVFTTLAALAGLSLVLDLKGHVVTANLWPFLTGLGLAFLAALATFLRMYLFGRFVANKNPAVVGAESFLFAAAFLLPVAFFAFPAPPQSLAGYLWTAVACASLVGGSFFMFYGIKSLGSFRFSLFLKLEPVFTSLFSVAFLSEILKISQYLGILLVIGSLALYQYMEYTKKAPPA